MAENENNVNELENDNEANETAGETKGKKIKGNQRRRQYKQFSAKVRLTRKNKAYAVKPTFSKEPEKITEQKEPEQINTEPEVEVNVNQEQPDQEPPAPQQEPPKEEEPEQEPPKDVDMIDGAKLHDNLRFFTNIEVVNTRVKSDINNILKQAGVDEKKADTLGFAEIIEDAYDLKKVPKGPVPMRDVAKHVFISTYDAMTKKGMDPKNKIETAQKIADILLKNYSPIMYTNRELDKYASNYVLNDKSLLQECLNTLNVPNPEKEAKTDGKKQENAKEKLVRDRANKEWFNSKLNTFNKMYGTKIDAEKFSENISISWQLMCSNDEQNRKEGRAMLSNLLKDTLKDAFEIEKKSAYDEPRIPEYSEILKSTNDLMRSCMFAHTDLYHDQERSKLFNSTSFCGINVIDLNKFLAGESNWKMDQKSDEAWAIQSQAAKNIAEGWLKNEKKPYDKMIEEMNALVEANKNGTLDRKEMYNKLTAAEWLLVNNDQMMIVKNDDDPLNKIPVWSNKYWKAITQAREALGIDKHISMRDLIQGEYAAIADVAESKNYNMKQFEHIIDPGNRGLYDSIKKQKEEFAVASEKFVMNENTLGKEKDDIVVIDDPNNTENRKRISLTKENEKLIMKQQPKSMNIIKENDQPQKTNELNAKN